MNSERSAVLCSGGLDSAILLAEWAGSRPQVFPLYVRSGLTWEEAELEHVHAFVRALQPRCPALQPLVVLEQPVRDLYGDHWSVTGRQVPGADTPDEAVYLPGRNVLLLTKALLWCHLHEVRSLAIGVLASNPFPDAAPAFFEQLAEVISAAVGDRLSIERPYGHLHKRDVMRRGRQAPLEWSFSCIQPRGSLHCGQCNKCHERQTAFRDAAMPDPTRYAAEDFIKPN